MRKPISADQLVYNTLVVAWNVEASEEKAKKAE